MITLALLAAALSIPVYVWIRFARTPGQPSHRRRTRGLAR